MFLAWWDLRDLSNPVNALLFEVGKLLPNWIVYLLSALIGCIGILSFVGLAAIANVWIERRVLARVQVRRGPNRVGPFGLLQPLADAIKLIQKEVLVPKVGDKVVFFLAPIVIFVPALLAFGVMPWNRGMTYVDLDVAVLYFLAVSSVTTVGVFMAGWSSNNKYSLLGAMRVIAMMVCYEVPMVLALLGPVLFTGTMSLNGMVIWQKEHWLPLILLQPFAALTYFIASTAELNRTPSDLAEAESEIVAGYLTEYSGMKWGLFYAVELVNAMSVSGLVTAVFLGGWWLFGLENIIPGWILFIAKMYFVYMILVWLRGTLPRLRLDQLMGFSWKFLVPLSIANILLVAFEVLLWEQSGLRPLIVLPIFVVVNIGLSVVLVVAWANILNYRQLREPRRPRLYRDIHVPIS
jgi:NADH-quinone oxidoreductase subunit H